LTEVETRQHRSVSQYNQYNRCPYSYKLARIDKVWARPAAWLPQGSAVHTVAEVYRQREHSNDPMSLEEAKLLFAEEYAKEIARYTEVTPNFEYWFASGLYRGETDVERRFGIGLEQVEKFVAWTESHPGEAIWIAEDGTPGIEIGFDFELDGVWIRGFIDAVIAVENDPPHPPTYQVRDYKTGNTPGDDFQLGVYKVALEEVYGLTVDSGAYYMAGKAGKKALVTDPYDLSGWTRERVSERFAELEANIQAERFDPKPDPKTCNFCDVALSCEFRAD
jgi:putative RecB family exonuclease